MILLVVLRLSIVKVSGNMDFNLALKSRWGPPAKSAKPKLHISGKFCIGEVQLSCSEPMQELPEAGHYRYLQAVSFIRKGRYMASLMENRRHLARCDLGSRDFQGYIRMIWNHDSRSALCQTWLEFSIFRSQFGASSMGKPQGSLALADKIRKGTKQNIPALNIHTHNEILPNHDLGITNNSNHGMPNTP